MYICVVIEVYVPSQERELSCISVLLLRGLCQARKEIYHVYLCCYWGVSTKPGKRGIMYICVVIEVSVPSLYRELSCISVLLLRCLYQDRKESYHVYLCCYWSVCTRPGKRVNKYICVVIEVYVPSQDRELSWYMITFFPGLVKTSQ
jgi:chorismate mutase